MLTDIEKGGRGYELPSNRCTGGREYELLAIATNCGGPFIFTRGGLRFLRKAVIYNVFRQLCLSIFIHVGHAKVCLANGPYQGQFCPLGALSQMLPRTFPLS